ncbi:hypothetical protein F3Y22_tig00013680pilonHSYRG00046 [Hibiscus syriacus]|uniref:Uncharacterized protein n=1 Tax=Hibiscus syriacus TaxID=106335 RepID=A0A6A3C6U3_HIBSY|nr:uncharacterized protein LOC120206272 [Hibiscus syriacus]KAE8722759.1 hypothetical protein F3Y22_tig00013680pilonHSYRG00046 [Hibiscus syriacus]
MNAMSTSPIDLAEESKNGSDSDSDTNHNDAPEYYQPISAVDDDDDDADQEDLDDQVNSDEEHQHRNLSNGYINRLENGISFLHVGTVDAEQDEEEEIRRREASDTAIRRAFREEESRRNAPLTPENAMRVREAMRGVSFAGLTPDWSNQIPEDRWIDQLRGLRQPQRPSSIV